VRNDYSSLRTLLLTEQNSVVTSYRGLYPTALLSFCASVCLISRKQSYGVMDGYRKS
jgi:hypothetical protein